MRLRFSWPRLLACAIVLGGVGAAGAWTDRMLLPRDGELAPGVAVAGAPVDRAAGIEARLSALGRAVEGRKLTLRLAGGGRTVEATLGALGVRVETDRMAALARAVGRAGSLADRLVEAVRARRGSVDVPLLVRMDAAAAFAALEALKEDTDEPPVPARIDFARRAVVPHAPGRYLDLHASADAIRAAALGGAEVVDLPRLAFEPRISAAVLEKIDLHETIARFETRFSRAGDQASRARNIETAAARLDGLVLAPGQVVSFNAVVGARTVENGFGKGWEIFQGEMVEGTGGGTCQVASTFHAAALLAGLDVVDRMPHSRPSGYITMGLDATVVYPIVDLKLRNPFAFPVVVHSRVAENTVTFELLGSSRPAEVEFHRDVVGVRPYVRRVEEASWLEPGRIVRKQHGIRGYTVRRTRTVTLADGTQRVETNIDTYPPTVEIYLVPPGTDAAAMLPTLPPDVAAKMEGAAAAPALPAAEAPAGTPPAPETGGSAAEKPKIVDARGVHSPSGEQAGAPARVIVTPR